MALKDPTLDEIRASFQTALRKIAPDANLESWFWELFAASNVSKDTLYSLVCRDDGNCPNMQTFCRLINALGPSFAHDVLYPLTGVHISATAPDALIATARQEIEAGIKQAQTGLAILAGDKVVPITGRGG